MSPLVERETSALRRFAQQSHDLTEFENQVLSDWVDRTAKIRKHGLLEHMPENERRRLGLTGSAKRWHLTAAICVRRRSEA